MMATREKLPGRRPTETVAFPVRQIEYRATLGYYPDGRLGEVFLNAGKLDSDGDIIAKEAAICLSFALQYGCPLDETAAAFPRTVDGVPEGPFGALIDLIKESGDAHD